MTVLPQRLRAAFIGTGGIATQHALGYREHAHLAEVVAVCDLDEGRARSFADEHGFGAVYTEITPLLEREHPDVVVISTPNFLHASQAIQSLHAGAHVFCEKPIATTLEDAYRMKEAAQNVGKILYLGFNHRLMGRFHLGKQMIADGTLGQVQVARIYAGHDSYQRLSRMWFGDRAKSGGGTLLDNGVHMLDLLRWYGEGTTEVSAQVGRLLATNGDVEDNALALFRLGTGGMASLQCSWTCPPNYRVSFHMICEHGAVDLSTDEVIIYRHGASEPEIVQAPPVNSYVAQVGRFLAAARGEEPPFATADDGIAVQQAIIGAYESSKTGRTVALNS
jgi:UDP-N-acetylglucosamine 3-dehydrogenase